VRRATRGTGEVRRRHRLRGGRRGADRAYPPPQPSGRNAEGEFFAPDQRPPILTWAGEKLRPEWAAAFLGGRIEYKPRALPARPHARVPGAAKLIARGLAAEHGHSPDDARVSEPDEQKAARARS
jgi:hypothetical protein